MANPYTQRFFANHEAGMLQSASVVAPLIVAQLAPASVIDVGCGRGAWLRSFQDAGVPRVLGVDGDYVDRESLLISLDQFRSADLTQPLAGFDRFDLAVCLEVAEHLPASSANRFVSDLIRLAPLVLFSAAIPGQGGTNHINEQWPEYWHERFAGHGYALLDPFRPLLRGDRRVEWWYRQNLLLYANLAKAQDGWLANHNPVELGEEMEWVHRMRVRDFTEHASVGTAAKLLAKALARRLGRRS